MEMKELVEDIEYEAALAILEDMHRVLAARR